MKRQDLKSRVDIYESVFGALAHAARRRVLMTIYFSGGSMTAGEIAAIFEHAWQTTTRHLRVLEAAGLLTHEKRGRKRIYRMQQKRLELVRNWLSHFSTKNTKSEEKQSWQQKKGRTRTGPRRRNARRRTTFRNSSGSTSKSAI